MMDYHTNALNEAVRRLIDGPFPPAAIRRLKDRLAATNDELNNTVLAEIPAFSESRNPDVLPDLARHGREHTSEIIRLLSGGPVDDFAFVRDYARRRTEQHFPLESTLHAYRCCHKVFARWVSEATLSVVSSPEDARQIVAAVSEFTMEYTDAISTIASSMYVSRTRLLADVAGDQRAELLIPTVIDQNPCAHLRMPRDMIFHGWSMRLFQAWQHSATMSS